MNKVAITLEPSEVQDLQRILLDEDKAAALGYLRDCIGQKVAVYTEARHCKPTFEWGGAEPSLLKSFRKKVEKRD